MTDLAAANTSLRSQRLRRRAVSAILEETDENMRRGARAGARVWPTGLDQLDVALGGGMRSTELILVGGAQSKGKTTIGLQMLRNAIVRGGTGIIFSHEHEAHTLLERLIAMEAAEVAAASGFDYDPSEIANVQDIRTAFEVSVGVGTTLDAKMAELPFALQALANVMSYADRLHIHESNQGTTVEEIKAVVDEVARETGDEPVILVDYLQKVPAARSDETARITYVAESLKNLSLTAGIPVISIVAADKENLGAGQRMRSPRHVGPALPALSRARSAPRPAGVSAAPSRPRGPHRRARPTRGSRRSARAGCRPRPTTRCA